MKNKKIIKERFFSGDKTKFYPFTPLKLNDNSLLDRSFTYKHEKKLNNLIQEIQISFDENKRLMPKKEQTNTRLKQLLKQRIFDLNKENPLISPTNKRNYLMKKTLRKTIISPVKGIQASCREEGSISKDLLKKFSYDNSLRSRESEFEHQPQKNTINDKKVKDNIIIKQRGLNLNDSVEKKCHSEIKSNKSKSLMNDNEDSLDDKQYKASNIFYLSLEAVEIIKKELKNPEEIRNFKKIDAYLKDLHYLKKFSIFFRKKIYRFCKFFEFKQNEAIFKEEDVSDNVYIILRGAISIQIANDNYQKMIKTLYEGEHFGNLNLIDKPIAKRKQSTTFISAETTYLLGINQENLKELYFSRNEKLQLYYFNFLRRLFIFENLDDFTISNFALNIQKKKFKYGERIITQGEIPEGMHIIFKGSCIALKEHYCVRNLTPSKYNVRLKVKSGSTEKRNLSTEENPRINYLKKYFNYNPINIKQYQYKEQSFYKKLNYGEIFTGYILSLENDPEANEKYSKEATYTVIADDVNVEIWIFEKILLNFLAKSKKTSTFLDLVKCVDLPNEKNQIDRNKEEITKWHHYKMKLYEDKLKEKFLCKKKN